MWHCRDVPVGKGRRHVHQGFTLFPSHHPRLVVADGAAHRDFAADPGRCVRCARPSRFARFGGSTMMLHLRKVRTLLLRLLTRSSRADATPQPDQQRSGRLRRSAPGLRGDAYAPRYFDTGEPNRVRRALGVVETGQLKACHSRRHVGVTVARPRSYRASRLRIIQETTATARMTPTRATMTMGLSTGMSTSSGMLSSLAEIRVRRPLAYSSCAQR
jgi:hypothetical protein